MLFLAYLFACVCTATAQTSKVDGVVISADDGQPIIGASITVKGEKVGAITDIDGTFTLENVPLGVKTLVVSFIGMKSKELPIKSNMKIVLESSQRMLNEVVVTALGISRDKKSIGNAMQTVKTDELTAAAAPSITSALSGKVAGTQVNTFGGTVGASARISIRGNSSLDNDQQPLIVVDGIPISNSVNRSGDNTYGGVDYGSGINDINVEDIESVTVLKGGAAALYGMRAGNGVILITTKSGNKKKGTTVSYDGSLTVDYVVNLPKMQNLYGEGHDGDEYHWKQNSEGLTYQDYSSKYGFSYVDGKGGGVNDGYDESWGPRMNNGLKLLQFDSNGVAAPWVSDKNNIMDFFQHGITQNHTVSVASTSDNVQVRASLSYRKQTGTVPNTDESRYGGSVNATIKLNKQVSMNFDGNYTRTKSGNLLDQGYKDNNPMQGLIEWSGRQINMKNLKKYWAQTDAAGNYTYYNWIHEYHTNPYFVMNKNLNTYQRDRFFGKSSLQYNPFSWLKVEGRMGVDYYNAESKECIYFDYDYPNGYFDQRILSNTEFNTDLMVTATKTFGNLNVVGIVGTNYRDNLWEDNEVECSGLTIPGVYTVGNATSPVYTMDHSHIRSNSVYGNLSLGWKGQLYMDASARNDWSSTIKKSFFYPSVSMSWLPLESFKILKSKTLSFFKLRASYADIGSATSAYKNQNYYYAEKSTFNGVTQLYKSTTLNNPDLKPENIHTWEVGSEIGLFEDRLHFDIAYYQKRTTDQILNITTSDVIGYSYMLVNAGQINNKGVELQFRGDILRSERGLNWTTTVNFSRDRSKVIALYKGIDSYGMGWTWGIATQARVGSQWGDLVGTTYQRTTDGAIKLSSDGTPVTASAQVMGNVNPDYLISWLHDFRWRNWSGGLMLDFRKGGKIWSQTMMHTYVTGTASITAKNGIRTKACVPGQDISTNERFEQYNSTTGKWEKATCTVDAQNWYESLFTANETYMFDGSFLKLREMHLTYDFPKSILSKTKYISRASISLVGDNVALLWVDRSNTLRLDPECGGVSSDSRGVGLEQASAPSSRSIGIKLNLTF
jgi:TonB-linked SusC/RagA family outer membrane protein